MGNFLTDDSNQIVYYIHVDGKSFGPYPSDIVASSMVQVLPLTESQKSEARIVPTTTTGKQVLMES